MRADAYAYAGGSMCVDTCKCALGMGEAPNGGKGTGLRPALVAPSSTLQNRTHHLEVRCVHQGVLMGSVLAPTPLHSSFLVLFLSEQETGPTGEAELRPLPLWSTTKARSQRWFPREARVMSGAQPC